MSSTIAPRCCSCLPADSPFGQERLFQRHRKERFATSDGVYYSIGGLNELTTAEHSRNKVAMKCLVWLGIAFTLGCHQSDPPLESGVRVRTMTDKRDGQLYPTTGHSGKLWLARNLDFTIGTSWCYNDDISMCARYGRMYLWEEAKRVCPSGWHLPSEAEWIDMAETLGGYFDFVSKETIGDPVEAYTAGTVGSFAATLGGSRTPSGQYIDLTGDGMYWTSTSCGADSAVMIVFNEHSKRILRDCDGAKGWAIAARCVTDVKASADVRNPAHLDARRHSHRLQNP